MNSKYRLSNPRLRYGLLGLIYSVTLLTLLSYTLLHNGRPHTDLSTSSSTAAAVDTPCHSPPVHIYKLTFTDKAIVPSKLTVMRCDQLEIINQTNNPVIAAIGPHEHHIHYPGFQETVLQHNQTYSFRLSEAGTFPLHDHDNDSLRATLVIKH